MLGRSTCERKKVSRNADLMKALTAKPQNSRAQTAHERSPTLGGNANTLFSKVLFSQHLSLLEKSDLSSDDEELIPMGCQLTTIVTYLFLKKALDAAQFNISPIIPPLHSCSVSNSSSIPVVVFTKVHIYREVSKMTGSSCSCSWLWESNSLYPSSNIHSKFNLPPATTSVDVLNNMGL